MNFTSHYHGYIDPTDYIHDDIKPKNKKNMNSYAPPGIPTYKQNQPRTVTVYKDKPKRKVESITVIGRRWFQRTYGNTYCTAEIIVNGEFVHKTPEQYGYDNYYLQAAFEWLDEQGITNREKYGNGGAISPWHYCSDNGIELTYSATDVKRERDL